MLVDRREVYYVVLRFAFIYLPGMRRFHTKDAKGAYFRVALL